MKNSKVNAIIIFLLTIIILFFLLKDDFFGVLSNLLGSNHIWIFLALLVYGIYFLLEQMSLYFLTKNIKKGIKFSFILKIGAITKFFNGITPLSSGGQPYEVYELRKKGIPISLGTSIVLQNYILFQISLIIFAFFSLALNKVFNYFEFYPVLKHLTVIGFLINIIILIFLVIVGFSNKFNKASIGFILNILSKIKLIKNREVIEEKWQKICNDYHEGGQRLLKSKKTFILCFNMQFLSTLCYYLIPFFIAKALYLDNINVINSLVASAYTFLMSCYVPLPGASGGVEYAFLSFFGNFAKGTHLTSMLLLYRFITYYAPCIVGAIMLIFHHSEKEIKEIGENMEIKL